MTTKSPGFASPILHHFPSIESTKAFHLLTSSTFFFAASRPRSALCSFLARISRRSRRDLMTAAVSS
ncbi:hypothetical protein [Candidatus Methanocrinis natronophilus]|uniref:Uncharacterized protein n=1 Tax=Candidatus Methanocrinis natronophilus TaxID=3033396 RepID=A0ABT5XAR2_9EURY|nr:hypothetical protein [Candidatus Methanocrinis natronophilus]MDF0591804.1 hypothetical protein [Candidatus Methanocrinis natronophilus]